MHEHFLSGGLVQPGPLFVRAVRELVEREGTVRTAKLLGVSEASLTRIRGSLGVRAGTLALAAQKLADLAPVQR